MALTCMTGVVTEAISSRTYICATSSAAAVPLFCTAKETCTVPVVETVEAESARPVYLKSAPYERPWPNG